MQTMNTLSAGFWGSYFCVVALVMVGAVIAWLHGIHRVARNAAISAAASGLFVVAFLGWLPMEDMADKQRLLGQIAALTSTLLLYMLLFMLGHLRRQRVRRLARWVLALMAGAVVLAGTLLPAYQALVLAVRDYVTKNGFQGAVLGLSGGIDSALTLAIAADAIGADPATLKGLKGW